MEETFLLSIPRACQVHQKDTKEQEWSHITVLRSCVFLRVAKERRSRSCV